MHDLSGFQRDLLYVIADLGDPKGLRIKEELEMYYGTDINHGRLYPNLDTLVEKGLIEKGQSDDRTNYYVLIKRGKRVLIDRRGWENIEPESSNTGSPIDESSRNKETDGNDKSSKKMDEAETEDRDPDKGILDHIEEEF